MTQLSKAQKVRKKELRRAMKRLREAVISKRGTSDGSMCYGLRLAIQILGLMRKEIDSEPGEV